MGAQCHPCPHKPYPRGGTCLGLQHFLHFTKTRFFPTQTSPAGTCWLFSHLPVCGSSWLPGMSSTPEHSLSSGAPWLGSKGESRKRRRQRIPASEDVHLQPDLGLAAEEGPSVLPAADLRYSSSDLCGKDTRQKGLDPAFGSWEMLPQRNRNEGGFLRKNSSLWKLQEDFQFSKTC